MSAVATAWAPAQQCPDATSKAVLKALAPYADANGEVWAYVALIAAEIQKDERTVQRGLQKLRKAEPPLLIDTGEWKTHEGRRLPIYRMPVEQGFANMAQRRKAEKEAERRGDTGVTPSAANGATLVSPQAGRGDMDVASRGDTGVALNERETKTFRCSSEHLQGACAVAGDGFEEGFSAYPESGQDRTSIPEARQQWRIAAAEVGAERLIAAVRRYSAEDRDLRHGDHGASAFERWLEGERWRRWLSVAGDAASAPARIPFAGPSEVLALLAPGLQGAERAALLLSGATWREADRTILTQTQTAADNMAREIGVLRLRQIDVRFERQPVGT